MKITEKVSFKIASEASYIFILSGQKFVKNATKTVNLASFWKPEACGQTVLPDRSILIGGKCQNWKTQMRHFGWFSNTVLSHAESSVKYKRGQENEDGTQMVFLRSSCWKSGTNSFWILVQFQATCCCWIIAWKIFPQKFANETITLWKT